VSITIPMVIALLVLSSASPAEGEADDGCIPVKAPDGTTFVSCKAAHSFETSVVTPLRPVRRSLKPRPVMTRIPVVVDMPGVGICRQRGAAVPRADYDAEPQYAAWERIIATTPPCPRAASEPALDPEAVVIEVLEEFPLPAPRPYIAPGRAITGLRAYLEPNLEVELVDGRATYTGTRSTPLGEVAIRATGTYMVDWGDERTGPHVGPGGPWPDGNISHVWTDMGTYDVVVSVEWDVAWRMGAESGRLTAPTEAAIVGFPVNQVQAVLHY